MNKLLSCRYSMDINRVEARFESGTALAIGCAAIENEYGNTPARRQNWTGCCTTGHWSTRSLCWVERSSIICHWAVTTADWKIKVFNIENSHLLHQFDAIDGCSFIYRFSPFEAITFLYQ